MVSDYPNLTCSYVHTCNLKCLQKMNAVVILVSSHNLKVIVITVSSWENIVFFYACIYIVHIYDVILDLSMSFVVHINPHKLLFCFFWYSEPDPDHILKYHQERILSVYLNSFYPIPTTGKKSLSTGVIVGIIVAATVLVVSVVLILVVGIYFCNRHKQSTKSAYS